MMFSLDDTIAAVSTPVGQGGIGLVRVSGPLALAVARRVFVPAHPEAWWLRPRRQTYGHVVVPSTGTEVDEVLLCFMPAPATYTRQDVIEISGHGGPAPLRSILAQCLDAGARMAHEGEFTLRAFMNGRIDLAQAEAVLDVILARTEASLRVAMSQLGGRLSARVRQTRGQLVDALASLEVMIDFPDEDVGPCDIAPTLEQVHRALANLLEESQRGVLYRQGLRTAIVGRPNVGKSSLLNALLRVERAIVTPFPGTTRDTVEETLNLQGIPLVLVDTAGISESGDTIEKLGISRSRQTIQVADLVLVVVDGSTLPSDDDRQVAALVGDRPAVVVVNKSDLPHADGYAALLPRAPHVALCATSGEGLPSLEATMLELILSGGAAGSEEPGVSNPRHRNALQRAARHVHEAQQALSTCLAPELVAVDVTEAINALGEITGESASEDLLENIFHNFCIGK